LHLAIRRFIFLTLPLCRAAVSSCLQLFELGDAYFFDSDVLHGVGWWWCLFPFRLTLLPDFTTIDVEFPEVRLG
jgi:hypothetical protein